MAYLNEIIIQGYTSSDIVLKQQSRNGELYDVTWFRIYVPPTAMKPTAKNPLVSVKTPMVLLIKATDSIARFLAQYCPKGTLLTIRGKLISQVFKPQYKDRKTENKKQTVTYIHVDRCYYNESKTGLMKSMTEEFY